MDGRGKPAKTLSRGRARHCRGLGPAAPHGPGSPPGHCRSEFTVSEAAAEQLVLIDAAHNQPAPCGMQDIPRQREGIF